MAVLANSTGRKKEAEHVFQRLSQLKDEQYNALYATQPTLIQASALMTMAVPIVVFLLAQRAFMRGVVVTGVDK